MVADGQIVDLALHTVELGPLVHDERSLLLGLDQLAVDQRAVADYAHLDRRCFISL